MNAFPVVIAIVRFLMGSIEPARLVFDKLQRKGDLRQANTTTALLLDKYTIT